MNDPITDSSIDSAQIYDGGNFNIITAEELKGNLVAIKQLINNYNEKNQKLDKVEGSLQEVRKELEFQNTYPYVAIFCAVANIIGTVLVGVAVNMITNAAGKDKVGNIVLVSGSLLILFANIFTITYRWVRGWFNKTRT